MSKGGGAKDLGKRYLNAAIAFLFAQVVATVVAATGNFSGSAILIAGIIDIAMVAGIVFYIMDAW